MYQQFAPAASPGFAVFLSFVPAYWFAVSTYLVVTRDVAFTVSYDFVMAVPLLLGAAWGSWRAFQHRQATHPSKRANDALSSWAGSMTMSACALSLAADDNHLRFAVMGLLLTVSVLLGRVFPATIKDARTDPSTAVTST